MVYTPWKLEILFVVYTFSPSMVWFRGVYTMEAINGFRGVHHGRGFWIFVVNTMEWDFAISWESGQVALVLFSNQGRLPWTL